MVARPRRCLTASLDQTNSPMAAARTAAEPECQMSILVKPKWLGLELSFSCPRGSMARNHRDSFSTGVPDTVNEHC
jgi:hypothetical protein